MPADLFSDEVIRGLAAQIDSHAMLSVLRHLRQVGFIRNGSDIDQETANIPAAAD
jgi:hypothetical protein